jgi:hypothetical protein
VNVNDLEALPADEVTDLMKNVLVPDRPVSYSDRVELGHLAIARRVVAHVVPMRLEERGLGLERPILSAS